MFARDRQTHLHQSTLLEHRQHDPRGRHLRVHPRPAPRLPLHPPPRIQVRHRHLPELHLAPLPPPQRPLHHPRPLPRGPGAPRQPPGGGLGRRGPEGDVHAAGGREPLSVLPVIQADTERDEVLAAHHPLHQHAHQNEKVLCAPGSVLVSTPKH